MPDFDDMFTRQEIIEEETGKLNSENDKLSLLEMFYLNTIEQLFLLLSN